MATWIRGRAGSQVGRNLIKLRINSMCSLFIELVVSIFFMNLCFDLEIEIVGTFIRFRLHVNLFP